MKIKFKKVILKNFLSFESAEVELSDRGYTLISGINDNPDDLAKSNGSGKSSLLESINWCLTGETIRGSSDVKRIGSEDECSVKLLFNCDGNEYELTRTKDPSNLKLIINGEDKSGKGIRDTSKILSEYLPDITPSLLGSVIILGQGLPQRFTNNTPSGRKEVLEKLSKSDFMIEDLKKRIIDRKSVLSTQIREKEDLNTSFKANIDLLTKQISDNESKLSDINYDNLKDKLSELTTRLLESENIISDISSKINHDTQEIGSIQNSLTLLSNSLIESTGKIDEKYKEIDTLNNLVLELNTKKNMLSSEINRLKSIKDICPTCGQKIPGVVKVDTTDKEEELRGIQDSWEVNNNKLTDLLTEKKIEITKLKESNSNESLKLNSELNKLNNNINSLKLDLANNNELKKNIESELSSVNNKIINIEATKRTLSSDIESAKSGLKDLNDKMLYNNSELDILNSHFNVINKMSNLITRDFRGYLLTNIINFIDKQAKIYCNDIFETDKISFVLDGNDIDISYDSKPYENLSGGEKQKVDIIIQLSIRDMLCKYLNFSSNILVLDEISDNIDSIGAERLFTLISNKLNDLETVFIISHHIDFQIPTDDELIVRKGEDKISRII